MEDYEYQDEVRWDCFPWKWAARGVAYTPVMSSSWHNRSINEWITFHDASRCGSKKMRCSRITVQEFSYPLLTWRDSVDFQIYHGLI